MRRALACLVVATIVLLAGAPTTLADGGPTLSLPETVVVDVENVTSGVATFSVSAVDGDNNDLPVSCDHSSGDSFSLGTTTVTCSATDLASVTASGSFDVVVRDTTFPVLDLPTVAPVDVNGATSAVVTYTASASDAGSPVAVDCSPASGATFALGTTTVHCGATDGAGNTTNGTFPVTVQDTTAPTLTLPSNITTSVDGNAKAVTFSATAADGGAALPVTCAPPSGSSFSLGTTTVNCNATDAGGNTATGSFTVTVQDTTAPSVSISSAPTGTVNSRSASVSFNASDGTTTCQLDGGGFTSCSSPASYSNLGDGAHTFTVRATDEASNGANASATWSIDATPPTLTLPGKVGVEADGPNGATVAYTVSAADDGTALLPSAISCLPKSGSAFELGSTTVTCQAADAHGNVAQGKFRVVVADTTAPAINAPDVSVTATSAAGIRRTDQALASYLSRVTATDLVSTPKLTNTVPEVLPVGDAHVTFTATDAAGNSSTRRVTITVLPVGKPAPPPDLTPPGDPYRVVAKAGDHRLDLSWKMAKGTAYVSVTLSVVGGSSNPRETYRGATGRYVAKGLRNGAAYRILLVAWDSAGNRSKGTVVRATPKAELLGAPRNGARVTSPPDLLWAPVGAASYFNVQLWRSGKKVLSVWPTRARLQLTRTWTYDGKKYTLEPGVYTWYVWPGIGTRADARYGALLGSRTFVVVKKTAKPKKPAV